jgi:hypothetical protein
MRIVLVVAAVIVAGCGGAHQRLAVSADGRSVLRDAADGHLNRDWSCGSLRAALGHLPPSGGPTYSTIPAMVGRVAGETCDAALAAVHVGMTSAGVTRKLGRPNTDDVAGFLDGHRPTLAKANSVPHARAPPSTGRGSVSKMGAYRGCKPQCTSKRRRRSSLGRVEASEQALGQATARDLQRHSR